jgi:predicted permease
MTFWVGELRADVKQAVTGLRNQPGLMATVVAVLGTAIGLNVTLFTLLAGVVWRPWGGLSRPSEVMRIYLRDATGPAAGLSAADARTLAATATSFTDVGVLRGQPVRLATGDEPRVAQALLVSGNLFDVLGLRPALGRRFTPADDRPGAPATVVVLSHSLWESRFAADPGIVGTTVRINDVPFTIVGVAPREFASSEPGYNAQVYLPIGTLPLLEPGRASVGVLTDPTSCCVDVVARLGPGVSRVQAEAELDVLARRFTSFSGTAAVGALVTDTTFIAQPGRLDSTQAMLTFTMLAGALVLVWLIACANVGNLLLARAAARLREMATRAALGASRGRLVRQLLTESAVLALVASAAGVAVAHQLPFVIFRLVATSGTLVQFPFTVGTDAWVLACALGLGALSVLACALAPALLVTRVALRHSVQQPGGAWGHRLRLRGVLLGMQVAVSVVLLVSATLLVRGVRRGAETFDPGFAVDDVTVVTFELPEGTYDRPRATALFGDVAALARTLPATEAAFGSREPFSLYREGTLVHLPGERREAAQQLQYLDVSPGYFELLRIAIVAGRSFTPADAGQPYVIVNEAMARRFWSGGQDAVGKTFLMRPRGPADEMVTRTVVGVARDVHANMSAATAPGFYRPVVPGAEVLDFISADPRASQAPVLFLKGPRGSVDALAPAVARLDGRIRVHVTRLADSLEAMLASAKWGPILAATLGAFALGLATVGMFGVFAYAVHQRTREIGIRMALGAQPAAVVRLVLVGHSRAVTLGLVVGLAGAMAASAGLRSRLYGLSPLDPATHLAVGLLLACCGLAASYVPARRATRISPIHALRVE